MPLYSVDVPFLATSCVQQTYTLLVGVYILQNNANVVSMFEPHPQI
jgi:hypothetical protein